MKGTRQVRSDAEVDARMRRFGWTCRLVAACFIHETHRRAAWLALLLGNTLFPLNNPIDELKLTRGPRRRLRQGRMGLIVSLISSTDRAPVVVLISVFTTAPKAQLTE